MNYTVIDNELLNDKSLSLKSKGLLCYLLSKLEGWKVRSKDIANFSTDGETSIRSALKELRECGYSELQNVRDDKGRITERVLVIRESPKRGEPTLREAHVTSKDSTLTNTNN